MGLDMAFPQLDEIILFKTHLVKLEDHAGPVEDPHDDLFAIDGGYDGDPEVDGAVFELYHERPVLGEAFLVDVEAGQYLMRETMGRWRCFGGGAIS